jgi:hypothetical protein
MSPRNELVNSGNLCLANEGQEYLIYSRLQHCRIRLPKDQRYRVVMINPQTGQQTQLPDANSDVDNSAWQYRRNLTQPMVFILTRKN